MQTKGISFEQRRLDNIRSRKWVEGEIENFSISRARLRISNVAPHLSYYVFVQMAHKAFKNHQRFVCYRGIDRMPKVAFTKQGLVCCQKVWVQ